MKLNLNILKYGQLKENKVLSIFWKKKRRQGEVTCVSRTDEAAKCKDVLIGWYYLSTSQANINIKVSCLKAWCGIFWRCLGQNRCQASRPKPSVFSNLLSQNKQHFSKYHREPVPECGHKLTSPLS